MEGAMNRMMSGVADFALGLAPEDVPDAARRDAALMLLDTLGVAAAAFKRLSIAKEHHEHSTR